MEGSSGCDKAQKAVWRCLHTGRRKGIFWRAGWNLAGGGGVAFCLSPSPSSWLEQPRFVFLLGETKASECVSREVRPSAFASRSVGGWMLFYFIEGTAKLSPEKRR